MRSNLYWCAFLNSKFLLRARTGNNNPEAIMNMDARDVFAAVTVPFRWNVISGKLVIRFYGHTFAMPLRVDRCMLLRRISKSNIFACWPVISRLKINTDACRNGHINEQLWERFTWSYKVPKGWHMPADVSRCYLEAFLPIYFYCTACAVLLRIFLCLLNDGRT